MQLHLHSSGPDCRVLRDFTSKPLTIRVLTEVSWGFSRRGHGGGHGESQDPVTDFDKRPGEAFLQKQLSQFAFC
jgi:hypothetical protein